MDFSSAANIPGFPMRKGRLSLKGALCRCSGACYGLTRRAVSTHRSLTPDQAIPGKRSAAAVITAVVAAAAAAIVAAVTAAIAAAAEQDKNKNDDPAAVAAANVEA